MLELGPRPVLSSYLSENTTIYPRYMSTLFFIILSFTTPPKTSHFSRSKPYRHPCIPLCPRYDDVVKRSVFRVVGYNKNCYKIYYNKRNPLKIHKKWCSPAVAHTYFVDENADTSSSPPQRLLLLHRWPSRGFTFGYTNTRMLYSWT